MRVVPSLPADSLAEEDVELWDRARGMVPGALAPWGILSEQINVLGHNLTERQCALRLEVAGEGSHMQHPARPQQLRKARSRIQPHACGRHTNGRSADLNLKLVGQDLNDVLRLSRTCRGEGPSGGKGI
jgi:hypothetical protein